MRAVEQAGVQMLKFCSFFGCNPDHSAARLNQAGDRGMQCPEEHEDTTGARAEYKKLSMGAKMPDVHMKFASTWLPLSPATIGHKCTFVQRRKNPARTCRNLKPLNPQVRRLRL